MDIETIAQVCHELNRVYCAALGDHSQPSWDSAPDWQKASAIQGVKFHQTNPGAGDHASHDNWAAQKIFEGWRYGEVKDSEAKTHPCLVPFDQLPLDQQIKDKLFCQTVHALLPLVGEQ